MRSSAGHQSGFSLIELIIVMSLISLFFFFALPRFQDSILTDHKNKVSRWIIIKCRLLKEQAVKERKTYTLRVSMDDNRFWIFHETMSEEELDEAEKNGYALPEEIRLLDVEYPVTGSLSAGQADINFYPKGYSDKALIHLEDDEIRFSFEIEPFLNQVGLHDEYVSYEE